jgi:hypothetical protein
MKSHLARSIDPRYPTVRAGLALAVVAGLAAIGVELQQGAGFTTALGLSVNLGTATFLGWAIGRELDPDDPMVASLAGAFTIPVAWLAGPVTIAATVTILMVARVVARTAGLPPTTLDQVGLVGLAALASATGAGWVAALGLSFGAARDVRLPGSTSRLQLVSSLAIAVAATARRLAFPAGPAVAWSVPLLALASVSLLAGATLRITRPPTSIGDLDGAALHAARIQSARRHTVVIAALASLFVGAAAVVALTPVLTALTAARIRQAQLLRRDSKAS